MRVKDGVSTSCRVKIKQGVERRVPRAIRPNIVENAIVEDTVTAADGHLAFPLRIPGKTDAWTKIMVLRLPHAADRIYSRSPNTGPVRGDIAPAQVSKLRDNPVNLARCAKTFPAKPQVDGQAACDFPVILSEHGVVMSGVVAVNTGVLWGGHGRGDRRFPPARGNRPGIRGKRVGDRTT